MFLKNFYSEKEKTMRCSVTIDNLGTLYFFDKRRKKRNQSFKKLHSKQMIGYYDEKVKSLD